MEPKPAEVERWDDNDFDLDGDEELTLRSPTTTSSTSVPHLLRRDSTSSHMSLRSDLDSWQGEEQHVHLPGDDERSTLAAIAAAESAGIPIPKNVPPSALTGGTIKRLRGRKIRRIIQDDWENDLELPDPSQSLHGLLQMNLKKLPDFPATLRQVSGGSLPASPGRSRKPQHHHHHHHHNQHNIIAAAVSVSSVSSSPAGPEGRRSSVVSNLSAASLDRFRDHPDDDDDAAFLDDVGPLTVAKNRRRPQPLSLPPSLAAAAAATAPPRAPLVPQRTHTHTHTHTHTYTHAHAHARGGSLDELDDFEKDLELPSDGRLKLAARTDLRTASVSHAEELDWGEGGSLGTRYGGTGRDTRSCRSSSISALSPSMSSTFTAESEDENLDGLVLPPGPVNFQERLDHRDIDTAAQTGTDLPPPLHHHDHRFLDALPEQSPLRNSALIELDHKGDFLDGLEIGDGDVFNKRGGRLTYHKNIKIKENRPASPARPRTAVSLTFSNNVPALPLPLPLPQARTPRLNHERAHATSLEPVSESGGPIVPQKFRRAQSRLGHPAHAPQSPGAGLSTPAGVASPTPPRRGASDISTRSSFSSLRNESSSSTTTSTTTTTTSAHFLRQKRSVPGGTRTLVSPAQTTLGSRSDRPPSRPDSSGRPSSSLRPKTPTTASTTGTFERRRSTADSPPRTKRQPAPFLPAGASQSQSHHIASKTTRTFRRRDSSDTLSVGPLSRSLSRTRLRSPSPFRSKPASDKWERLSRPKSRRHFGDGHELDAFDDLPTSKESESRFLKHPGGNGNGNGNGSGSGSVSSGTLRRPAPLAIATHADRTSSPPPRSPRLPKTSSTPSFARDTASSRIARETSLAHRTPSGGHLLAAAISAQRAAPVSTRGRPSQQPPVPPSAGRTKKTRKRPKQAKPHLIANLNSDKESRVVNGMFYNAEACRWEGNDHALSAFELSTSTAPSTASGACHVTGGRDKEASTPRPALITNFSATKGVQVVGGMVFDPHNMCWLKLGPQQGGQARSEVAESVEDFNTVDEDEDVFKDIPDLEEAPAEEERDGRASDIKDDWLVGEEFDVGPAFIRRHREEEQRWRRKCEKWIGQGRRDQDVWRWTIRELVSQFDELPMTPGVDENEG